MHCNCCCSSSKMLLLFLFLEWTACFILLPCLDVASSRIRNHESFRRLHISRGVMKWRRKAASVTITHHLEALISNDCGTQDVASTLTPWTCDTAIFYSPWTWLGSCWDQWITPPRRSSLDQWQSTPANSDTACPCWCAGSPTCRTAPVPLYWSCEGLWSRSATTIVLK